MSKFKQKDLCSKCLSTQCECENEMDEVLLKSIEERFKNMFKLYKLNDKHELVEVDIKEFGEMFKNGKNRIASDYIYSDRYGIIRISTVFLGIMHYDNMIFETMVFREKNTNPNGLPIEDDIEGIGFWGEMRRYRTYDEAIKGHKEIYQSIAGKPLLEIE